MSQTSQIDSLLILIPKAKPDTNKIKKLIQLSSKYNQLGMYDSAMSYAFKSLDLSEKLMFKPGKASAYSYLGVIYKDQGDYTRALEYHQKSLELNIELNNVSKSINNYGNIGLVYWNKGDYRKALNYYYQALKIAEKTKNKQAEAIQLGNIGIIYNDQKQYKKALECSFKALQIKNEIGLKNETAGTLCNIGLIYSNQNDYDKAISYYNEALQIAENNGDLTPISTILGNLGITYSKQNNTDKALEYYTKALKISEQCGNKNDKAYWLGSIGSLYTTIKKYKEAEIYLKEAIKIGTEIGALNGLREDEETIAVLYDIVGRHKEALLHYKKSVQLKDSLFSQENKKELVRKELNHEFEKKEAATKAENEKQQALAQAENRRQTVISWSIGGGLLLVIVFAGFVLRSLRLTNKQKAIIEAQKDEVTKQKDIAEELRLISEKQKHIVEEKQKEIVDSITYAKRIQTALLTSDEYIRNNFEAEHFILFKPKDIVSGDFYWALSHSFIPGWDLGITNVKLPAVERRKNLFYIATADCTGHGVPGAFMSMLNISFLNENIIERGILQPHEILNAQRKEIIKALNPEGSKSESKDGMDCILCVYDFNKMLLHFAAANNPLWLIRNNELIEFAADKMPVGKFNENNKPFTLQTVELQKGDVIYTSTDGFADQFGDNGKKLIKKRFKEELLGIHQLTMREQKDHLNNFFEKWKGSQEQVDDVCVIGVRV
ncbi:MAG: tetratricopeptide repeat protein [Bacteroidia bacterium]|jgi:tetratricopeptide (TPR) repeat protein